MELNSIQRVYLIGIGGIGMSGLARYFQHRGCLVAGYDKTQTALTTALEQENIEIAYHDEIDYIPFDFNEPEEGTLVIYTPAVPANSLILNFFQDKKFTLKKRSEVLGIISKGMFTIAVAGTHGKTTTSCMIAHVMRASGNDCSAFLGGIATNYQTNVLFGSNEMLVVEADEYDRSFLTLHPDIAVVTSMDADHLDIYGDKNSMVQAFQQFASQVKTDGKLIYKKGLPLNKGVTYATDAEAEAIAENIRIENGTYHFDFKNKETQIKAIQLGIAGIHNVENAVAAIQTALFLEVGPKEIKAALKSFLGIKRRFEYIINTNKAIYIDDYAHHPEELRACITSVKELYPDKELTVIFQPHLYTRTRDFADEFAEVLSQTNHLLLLNIYPARELPIEGVNAEMILERMKPSSNAKKYTVKEALDYVQQQKPELLLTVGAGDIDKMVEPLKAALQNV
ncbi:UDP-N-acetylmuramate--L-alanine ligase [Mucilaginibacter arboris]|uniref:UDP-N-acetylmuramate--L-alanine ligase n=1 Tax=Mucilaginibacter arboris TaxID=2682090 RepID=A0A7K1SUL0_9SPHI|nr:UDP-N-acetylmuramate--L-alanine ligase [Mucilaginibacter arboris]MVN20740.1 UDP-N-acetylmuramate--L-alanine ligase [Mucilaginibacter arboris]